MTLELVFLVRVVKKKRKCVREVRVTKRITNKKKCGGEASVTKKNNTCIKEKKRMRWRSECDKNVFQLEEKK